ncbi:hypothetical protein E6O75_ATG02006 [Venturia nashicola]|uniref:Uncharacterized protein n=1 Tax=Venturia nashicola TaxID=86259 RepID=A0A4Z1PKE1_9PEZI|nr:hypothetical protein E6O75_ATG02006 [Venturia nashicola]
MSCCKGAVTVCRDSTRLGHLAATAGPTPGARRLIRGLTIPRDNSLANLPDAVRLSTGSRAAAHSEASSAVIVQPTQESNANNQHIFQIRMSSPSPSR